MEISEYIKRVDTALCYLSGCGFDATIQSIENRKNLIAKEAKK